MVQLMTQAQWVPFQHSIVQPHTALWIKEKASSHGR